MGTARTAYRCQCLLIGGRTGHSQPGDKTDVQDPQGYPRRSPRYLGVAATASQPANAFTAPSADAIIADTLTTNVSCGGIDCDHPSQRGYRRYNSEGRSYRRRRYRSYRAYRGDGYRSYHRQRRYEQRMRKRQAAAACRELGLELRGGRCRPTRLDDIVRSIIKGGQRCPRGTYRNPYGRCQPNETGG